MYQTDERVELEQSPERCYDRACTGTESSPQHARGAGLEWVDIPTGDVAQLGERLVCNQEVEGSIPFVSTHKSFKSRNLGRGNPTKELSVFWLPVTKTRLESHLSSYTASLSLGTKIRHHPSKRTMVARRKGL
jgi:hypothetical protein